jgi:hypothetical protein
MPACTVLNSIRGTDREGALACSEYKRDIDCGGGTAYVKTGIYHPNPGKTVKLTSFKKGGVTILKTDLQCIGLYDYVIDAYGYSYIVLKACLHVRFWSAISQ